MAQLSLRFERDYEFPRVIVWDALVDSDLVSGWLAEATVVAEPGGEFTLADSRSGQAPFRGRVESMRSGEALVVEAEDASMEFSLEHLDGGNRGSSTRLHVTVGVAVDRRFAATVQADWLSNLDQLEDLLRGHPVDWAHWQRDYGESWLQHRGDKGNSTA